MPYKEVVDKLRTRYNKTHRKLSLQSEVDSLTFEDFMAHQQIRDEKECLRRIVEYLNKITSQLVDGFHSVSSKIQYLRNGVLRKRWATTPLTSIYSAQYNLGQLGMALNESFQQEREIERLEPLPTLTMAGLRRIPSMSAKNDNRRNNHQSKQDNYHTYCYNNSYQYEESFNRNRLKSPNQLRQFEQGYRINSRFRINSRNKFDRSLTPSRSRYGDRRPHRSNQYQRTSHLYAICHVLEVVACSPLWRTINARHQ